MRAFFSAADFSPPPGLRGNVHHTMTIAIASATTISRNTQPKIASMRARRVATLSAIAISVLAAGCAAPTPAPAPVAKAPEALVCPPPEKPLCPFPTPPTPPAAETRGKIVPASWADLPDWGREPIAPALEAFVRSCDVLEQQDAWKAVCGSARSLGTTDERVVSSFFELNFDVHQVLNPDDGANGMVTGYYEPLLRGSRSPSARYAYPLYAAPPDLLTIDLASLHPDLRHRRLRGRLEGNRVVPYLARGEIDSETTPLKGREIVWVDDAVDAFFLHIQGSGQVQLDNGERIRVGYADQNGHPFRSLGGLLIRRGELAPERASMQGIKDWARRNPVKAQEFMNANPSYVFFRELPRELPGPIGSLGVPLTAERSIAVDPRVIPLGVPVYLATTWPNTAVPLNRLMVAQDTGGAITGAVRVDFFWGFGDAAGQQAGRMRQGGRMWVLLPKGMPAPAIER